METSTLTEGAKQVTTKGRTPLGRWPKGQSGNPGGRPAASKEFLDAVRDLTPQALLTLESIMVDTKAPAAARLRAVELILDRGWGTVTASATLEALQQIECREMAGDPLAELLGR